MNLRKGLAVAFVLLTLVGCVQTERGQGQAPYAPYSPDPNREYQASGVVEATVQCSRQRLPTLGQSQAANVFDLECGSRSKSGAGHDPETQSERVKLGVS